MNEINALTFFSKTKYGRRELAKYAKAGQSIAGYTFTEDGIYHKKGINLQFKGEISKNYYSGTTTPQIAKGQLNIVVCLSNVDVGSIVETICHELFIHAHQSAQDYFDNKKLDNSNMSEQMKKWGREGASADSQEHGQDARYNKRMKNEAVPILMDFYKSKSREEIIKIINDGMGKYNNIR